ncbi:MAG: DUF2147 domain-containing protein [Bacteroidota bacterium]|nr:DUF2147 domain-containing protein [Bacteroidota bacterium]
MKKTINLLFALLVIGCVNVLAQTKEADAIIGTWMTEKQDAKFQIYRSGEKYYGKILWGKGEETKDTKNPDASLRQRNVIGLNLLSSFVYKGKNSWEDGSIYDPREGKTYSCTLTLISYNKLSVRGFIGVSLFGRSEIWTKTN